MQVTVDRSGRVIIPKEVRNDLGLQPGTKLQIKKENGKILLEPISVEMQIVVKDGVLVFRGAAAGEIERGVRSHHENRLKRGRLTITK
jgi:AbrB family looped-hinge helix DNA binding protein